MTIKGLSSQKSATFLTAPGTEDYRFVLGINWNSIFLLSYKGIYFLIEMMGVDDNRLTARILEVVNNYI